jgi:hypothetical protein
VLRQGDVGRNWRMSCFCDFLLLLTFNGHPSRVHCWTICSCIGCCTFLVEVCEQNTLVFPRHSRNQFNVHTVHIRHSRNDQQYALVAPLLYSISWLLHVSAVVCHKSYLKYTSNRWYII